VGGVEAYLVVGNGSACRTERAPGSLDPRAEAFDAELEAALRDVDTARLRGFDPVLAQQLWAGTGAFAELAELLQGTTLAAVDFADAPFGVQYWVMRWSSAPVI